MKREPRPPGQVVASDHHPQKRSPRSNGKERWAQPANQGEGHESLPQAMTRGCGDAHAREALHGCTRREGAALIGKWMVQTRAITRPL